MTPNIVTAATGTGMSVKIEGVFDVTAGGTIIPSVDLLTATAAVIQAGSYFKCKKIADTGTNATSEWS